MVEGAGSADCESVHLQTADEGERYSLAAHAEVLIGRQGCSQGSHEEHPGGVHGGGQLQVRHEGPHGPRLYCWAHRLCQLSKVRSLSYLFVELSQKCEHNRDDQLTKLNHEPALRARKHTPLKQGPWSLLEMELPHMW